MFYFIRHFYTLTFVLGDSLKSCWQSRRCCSHLRGAGSQVCSYKLSRAAPALGKCSILLLLSGAGPWWVLRFVSVAFLKARFLAETACCSAYSKNVNLKYWLYFILHYYFFSISGLQAQRSLVLVSDSISRVRKVLCLQGLHISVLQSCASVCPQGKHGERADRRRAGQSPLKGWQKHVLEFVTGAVLGSDCRNLEFSASVKMYTISLSAPTKIVCSPYVIGAGFVQHLNKDRSEFSAHHEACGSKEFHPRYSESRQGLFPSDCYIPAI